MTKEEMKDARKICEKVTPGPWEEVGEGIYAGNDLQSLVVAWPHDEESYDSQFIAASRTLLPQALDALEEANREIERLSAVAKKLGAWDCEKCQRMFVESMLTISPHSAVCDSCLGESTT